MAGTGMHRMRRPMQPWLLVDARVRGRRLRCRGDVSWLARRGRKCPGTTNVAASGQTLARFSRSRKSAGRRTSAKPRSYGRGLRGGDGGRARLGLRGRRAFRREQDQGNRRCRRLGSGADRDRIRRNRRRRATDVLGREDGLALAEAGREAVVIRVFGFAGNTVCARAGTSVIPCGVSCCVVRSVSRVGEGVVLVALDVAYEGQVREPCALRDQSDQRGQKHPRAGHAPMGPTGHK
jgi:hypothetical protein